MSDAPARPPALTRATRKEIETRLRLVDGVDPFAGDPKAEGFQRVLYIGQDALLTIKKMEARYMQRMHCALVARDTGMMLAAVYGMQIDMGGRFHPSDIEKKSHVMSALNIVSRNDIGRWFRDMQFGGMTANFSARRALVEYLDEKLAKLDVLVAEQFLDKKAAEIPAQDETEEVESAAPGMR